MKRLLQGTLLLATAVALVLLPSHRDPTPPPSSPGLSMPIGADVLMPVPGDNPLSHLKVELGRRLFFDPGLSRDGTVSCATCHKPELAFSDGRNRARGIGGRVGRRNSPSLVDCAYRKPVFWDGRAASLEDQALLPIENPDEMGHSVEEVVADLREDPSYSQAFALAFGSPGVSRQRVAMALASFQRTIVAPPTPFDLAETRVDGGAIMSESARRGRALFEGRARCVFCHRGLTFSDGGFHNTGVGWVEPRRDRGRYEVTGREEDDGRFRTPTLRGLVHTAPYMHDGSIATLREVVEFYDRGANPNPRLDPAIRRLGLSDEETDDLVAFLRALSAARPVWAFPGR